MKVTKFEHACLVIEEQGKKLVIDPGDFANLPELADVVALVITHVHFDHLNNDKVAAIIKSNPSLQIFSVPEVKEQIPQVIACADGDQKDVGPFKFSFFGNLHSIIHPDYPKFQNIGVLVNSTLYYAGDSLTEPNIPVKVLAVPASGPWAKAGEVMDYMAHVKPELAFPTHDFLNSEVGNDAQDHWFSMHAKKFNIDYKRLRVGESIEI